MNKFIRKNNYLYPAFAFIRDLPLKIFSFFIAFCAAGTAMGILVGIIGLVGFLLGANSIKWVLECKVIMYPAGLITVILALVLMTDADWDLSKGDNDF